jgi:hypothetical protein
MIYAHLMPERTRDAVKSLDPPRASTARALRRAPLRLPRRRRKPRPLPTVRAEVTNAAPGHYAFPAAGPRRPGAKGGGDAGVISPNRDRGTGGRRFRDCVGGGERHASVVRRGPRLREGHGRAQCPTRAAPKPERITRTTARVRPDVAAHSDPGFLVAESAWEALRKLTPYGSGPYGSGPAMRGDVARRVHLGSRHEGAHLARLSGRVRLDLKDADGLHVTEAAEV